MAFTHGTNGRIWMDGFAASAYLDDVSMNGKTDVAETTTLTKTAKEYIPGLDMSTVKLKGFFDSNTVSPASTFEAFLNARRRTIFATTFFPEGGDTINDPAYLLNGFMTDYAVDAMVKDAVTLKMEFQTNSGLQYGRVLLVDGTRTTTDLTGVQGRIDGGVSSANGAVAILSTSAVLGTSPTLDVKLQHSTNDSVWTDVSGGAFVQQTSVTGVKGNYLTVSGTINRYVRVVWTIAGTTPSFTFNVAFRRL